tara:strand:+ start:440 stop:679 length:240 start_codon:yes stop_codon:yes gene_type:complete
MNKAFKSYVRESAFRLSLTNRQIKALMYLAEIKDDDKHIYVTYEALRNKGLIKIQRSGTRLTKEGEIVVDLLVCSGYGG